MLFSLAVSVPVFSYFAFYHTILFNLFIIGMYVYARMMMWWTFGFVVFVYRTFRTRDMGHVTTVVNFIWITSMQHRLFGAFLENPNDLDL